MKLLGTSRRLAWLLIITLWLTPLPMTVQAQTTLPLVNTESPRDTITTLLALRDALDAELRAYALDKTAERFDTIGLLGDEVISLIDLSAVPSATRQQVGTSTSLAVLDILEHLKPFDPDAIPDIAAIINAPLEYYPLRGSPLRLQKIDIGPREGEYLFSGNTATAAPRFVEFLPRTGSEQFWIERLPQVTGPWVPSLWPQGMPMYLTVIKFGTPVWKLALSVFTFAFTAALFWLVYSQCKALRRRGVISRNLNHTISVIAGVTALLLFEYYTVHQLLVLGGALKFVTFATTITLYTTMAWVFWRLCDIAVAAYTRGEKQGQPRLDSNLARMMFHLVGLIGAVWILATGAQTLGFPLLSILAGLGVGGLAVALAIRPTLENFISGFVLYTEKSVKVGDYCSFGEREGTIERIGVRSTRIRALDRTLISVPNSNFVNLELVNWARCDEMLIRTTIGLRYETDADQLRFVLAEIRKIMYAHPRINSDTVRVRFIGYGASSLDIEIRVYAMTREWNDFYAIQEDVLFRTKIVVETSGTGFAFPSQTVYMSRDTGLDAEKTKKSVGIVDRWRKRHELPFPNFSATARQSMENMLMYPPPGSPEATGDDETPMTTEEPLSVDEPLSIDNPEPDAPDIEENEQSADEATDEMKTSDRSDKPS